MNTIQNDEPPHLIRDDGDRGGNVVSPSNYWRQFLLCSDGTCVCGCGDDAAEATRAANKKRDERHSWINSPSKNRIREILSKGCRGTREQDDFNKAIAEFLGILINS